MKKPLRQAALAGPERPLKVVQPAILPADAVFQRSDPKDRRGLREGLRQVADFPAEASVMPSLFV
ncbi:hypothetical protein ABNQ38_03170 [Azospirillum sp. A29]|uniref:hypothetical protein n=1 Tax=Azospirillum sp. A29 TaxID=3160606 RepID=UPI00366E3E9A